GIEGKAAVRATNLSGRQQHLVTIAMPLTQQPKVILADEPVASLDPPTSHKVMKDLKRVSREDGLTTIVNLHFIDMAMEYADRIIGLRDGKLVFDGPIEEVTDKTFEEIYDRPIKDDDLLGSEEETDESLEARQVCSHRSYTHAVQALHSRYSSARRTALHGGGIPDRCFCRTGDRGVPDHLSVCGSGSLAAELELLYKCHPAAS